LITRCVNVKADWYKTRIEGRPADKHVDESTFLTVRGAAWHTDAYHCSPGRKCLLTLIGGKHGVGGIAGYDAKETDDEDPDRLAVVQRLTWAYLRSALYAGDPAWSEACKALEDHASSQGRVECK